MRFDHQRKNHAARYLLNNWTHYEKNIDELRPQELENAKILFSGLQMLTQEEQMLLASKYRAPIGMRMSDSYIALNKGIYLETYTQRKAECETTLQEEEIINDRVDRECIEMIREIEEAVSYRFFGSEPGTYIDDAPDINQVSEDEFAEAFDDALLKMISRLG